MAFVKLDTGILDSTLWVERECREVFITALLMALPRELSEPIPQLEVRSIKETGWHIPAGWYGFIEAAGIGIVRRAMVEHELGLAALEKLGAVDQESRSKDFEGRRLVRVDGGFIVLNFMKYRDRDYTAAVRAQRYRERKKAESHRDGVASHRDITQAEAEAEAEAEKTLESRATRCPPDFEPTPESEVEQGIDRPKELANFRDHWKAKRGKEAVSGDWQAKWRQWVRNAHKRPADARNMTVAGPSGPDPALAKLDRDSELACRPSAKTRAKMAELSRPKGVM